MACFNVSLDNLYYVLFVCQQEIYHKYIVNKASTVTETSQLLGL